MAVVPGRPGVSWGLDTHFCPLSVSSLGSFAVAHFMVSTMSSYSGRLREKYKQGSYQATPLDREREHIEEGGDASNPGGPVAVATRFEGVSGQV